MEPFSRKLLNTKYCNIQKNKIGCSIAHLILSGKFPTKETDHIPIALDEVKNAGLPDIFENTVLELQCRRIPKN